MWQYPRLRVTYEKEYFIFLFSLKLLGIANFLMFAVNHGDASTVIPIANMSFVLGHLVLVASKMEKLVAK